jgi:hypothetical protein
MITLLVTHISIAVLSLGWTAYLLVRPAQRRFYVSYGLMAATLVSGAALVFVAHGNVLQATISGLLYLAVAGLGTWAAHWRQQRLLAAETVRIDSRR